MTTHAWNGLHAPKTARRLLLACGILAPLLYVASDIGAAMLWEGYSYTAQSVSELRAIGAPTRPLLVPILLLYAGLEIAFGVGAWRSAGRQRAPRLTGALLIGLGFVDLVAPFFPMHLRGAEKTLTDPIHIVLTVATVLLILLIIGFGARADGQRFRHYSYMTILALAMGGAWAFLDAPRIAANLPTPWVGVRERIHIYGYMLWMAMLALVLLRANQEHSPITGSEARGHTGRKKVTVFVGGGRKRGVTLAATQRFLDNLRSFGDVQGEIVVLGECDLGLCRGCKVCFERGEEFCPLTGDRDALIEKMMISDGVAFASPNYSFQVSAIMKAFLDRLGFLFHRPRFHGKAFTAIVIQAFYGGGKIVKYLEFVGLGLGFNVVRGSCITALEPMTEKERRMMDRALARQSRRFHRQLLRPAHAAPSLFQVMGFRMARTSIKQMLGDDDRDRTYYRDQGWFDSDYYYPTRLGTFKKAVGAFFDRIFALSYTRREPALQLARLAGAAEPTAEENGQ